MSHTRINTNRSVLNTDAFDKRRFREMLEMSSGLRKLREESVFPMFEPLLADIWASFYKMKPEIIKHVDSDLRVNKSLMERILADASFQNLRNITRLSELLSVIGTVKFGEKTNQWLTDRVKEDGVLHQQMQLVLTTQRELQKQVWRQEEIDSHDRKSFSETIIRLNEQLQLEFQNNPDSFSQALLQAVHETKQVKDGLIALLGGIKAGSGDGELKKIPLRDQLSLAERIISDEKMKEIAEWAGRFKQIARKKQKANDNEAMERSGVTFGNDIGRLLPNELGMYMHPMTKADFLRRFVEGQTMMYEQKGRGMLGKGPIILCLDQSGSMRSLDTQAKGFTLALMSIARRQRRDFCLVLFSTRTHVFTYEKGKIKSTDLVQLAQTFLSGGTDFALPLSKSLSIVNESRFKQADVVFVTDGEDELIDSFLEEFKNKKKEKSFNVLSFVLGSSALSVDQFSDKVVNVKDFEDEGCYTAFNL